jgi:hypothetical protein
VGRNSDQWKKVKQPIQNGVPKSLTKPEFCRRKHLAKPSLPPASDECVHPVGEHIDGKLEGENDSEDQVY